MLSGTLVAGSGGQGVLFLGKLLAQAAMIAGKNVTFFPSYGAEMRGGTANCTVVISDWIIGSPVVRTPDAVVAMNEASVIRFEPKLRPGGLMIYNSSLVKTYTQRDDLKVIACPASEIAAALGDSKAANMVLLGALVANEKSLGIDDALAALEHMTPPRRRDALKLNIEALRKGFHCGEDTKSAR